MKQSRRINHVQYENRVEELITCSMKQSRRINHVQYENRVEELITCSMKQKEVEIVK